MEAKDTVVFAYGRFNPPTTGHEKLIQKVVSIAGANPYRIYPSHSQNPKKDPLPQALKTAYMRKMFKKYARNIAVTKSKNAIEIAVELYDQGYKNLVMVAGSDRVKVFDAMLNNYNGVEGKAHGYYKFDNIDIVSAGERDPDSEGVEGMSASKMRAAASDGDIKSFSQGVPSGFSDSKKLYRDVRKYMGIREDRDMGDMTDFETLRDAYLTGKVWNVGDVVEANGVVGEIVRKGTNYLSIVDVNGKVYKAWLHEINEGVKDLPPHLQKLVKQLDKKEKELEKKGLKVKTFIYNPDTGKPDIELDEKLKGDFVLVDKDKRVVEKGTEEDMKQIALNSIYANLRVAYDPKAKIGSRVREEVELDERNYRNEYDNYHARPEQREKNAARLRARRLMVKNGKVTKFDDMDVHHKDNNPLNNEEENLEVTTKKWNRTEPRLRKEDVKLDEEWWNKVFAKLSQTSHPKEYGKMVKQYAELMRDDKYKKRPNMAADKVAREYSKVSVREFIKYINKLVAKKILPQELKAEYELEEWSFKDFVNQIQKGPIKEVLAKDADMGDYIDDFVKSDAPQFNGKSKEKRKEMAIAAYYAKNESLKT
jgi:hypothetical protein